MATAAATAAAKLSKLRSKQTRLRNFMTSFNVIQTFVEQYDEQKHAGELASRLEKLEPLWEKIDEAMTEAELAESEEVPEGGARYVKERVEFQNKFYAVKGFLLSRLRDCPDQASSLHTSQVIESTIATSSHSHPHVKLPLISLPKFSGNVEEWLAFRDLYVSLIHFSTDLPEIEKFHYLRSQLDGEALAVISSLSLTQANYTVAWDLLVKRYSNSKVLKKKQVQNLFDFSVMKRESVTELCKLVEGFEKTTKVIDQVVQPEDYKDLFLIHLLGSRLDDKTRRSWEEHSATLEAENFKDILEFLQRRIRVLESLPNRPPDQHQPTLKKTYPPKLTSHGAFHSNAIKCPSCSDSHLLFTCPVFGKLSVNDREKVLRQHSLCRNCFHKGHQAKDCTSRFSCRRCRERHHTLVCYKPEEKPRVPPTVGPANPAKAGEPSNAVERISTATATEGSNISSNAGRSTRSVLLATAVVLVEDDRGNKVPARALLDSGSECNIMSTHLSQKLRIKRSKADVQILGVGLVPTKSLERVHATVKSRLTDYSEAMEFYVLAKVTEDLPTSTIITSDWELPTGFQLADPDFFKTNTVDLLLGGEFFFDFFPAKKRVPLGPNLPLLVESVFGWLVTGRCGVSFGTTPIVCKHSVITDSLELLMKKFWECEDGGRSPNYSVEETSCEEHFVRTTRRGEDGRYTVGLPKAEGALSKLGDSRAAAYRRLMLIERRLSRDETLKSEYHSFITEYLETGHMRKIVENPSETNPTYYLPHHPVIKNSSTTTRVRVVFDASSKTSTGVSLNDVLLNGPVIQDDLRTIIMRSRLHPILLVADVEKMFRQIRMDPSDQPLQRILWRFTPDQPVDAYELSTVTYGTKPAPFLATRSLKQLSIDEAPNFPLAARRVAKDVYMDDVITGANDVEEARAVRSELDSMLLKGGFRLRKWASNNHEALDGIGEDCLAIARETVIDFDAEQTVKTLGLVWVPKTDTLRFQFDFSPVPAAEFTKRKVLSCIARIFDPLGLVGPVVTGAKIFMQKIWELKDEKQKPLGWDDLLPQPMLDNWVNFYSKLPNLDDVRVPRFVKQSNAVRLQLHCFSDASEKAYGACIYLRSADNNGHVTVRLIASKSRVAPLKRQTIPRLELCGARLAVELYVQVKESLDLSCETYFWTDSRTVLQWLAQTPNTWTVFVAHRVSFIQHSTQKCHWNHVPGVHNPADQLSRGLNPGQLVTDSVWWNGPPWLAEEGSSWPEQHQHHQLPESEAFENERRKTVATAVVDPVQTFNDHYFDQFNEYYKLRRYTAYWRRYLRNLRAPEAERIRSVPLTTKELNEAETCLVRLVQQEVFEKELNALSRGDTVHRSSKLRWFSPRLTQEGVIRVGGRLDNSVIAEEAKHPMVIPGGHQFSKLLAGHYHRRLLHAGAQLMLSTIRLRFWPLGGRQLCRMVSHKCLICYRAKPKLQQQFMGQLPSPRVTAARPFSTTGVDYFGPVYIKQGFRKGPVKAYVAVFVCFCTKAVHLELVSDLSTARFLQALRRFTARRGRCAHIYSDNGTNFVGARNALNELLRKLRDPKHHEEIQRECSKDGIQWHFIPPGAPHFGGLWEAAVRSAKKHLLRVLGSSSASHEDFITLLTQVEGCLNSRPLTQLSDDPTDLQPLTPAHFLIGSSLQDLPDKNYRIVPANGLPNWQLTQQQLQNFWDRWHTEYLSQLQARVKNWQPPINIEPGRLVIVVDENQPSMKWKMARIHEVHPGHDEVVRVVTLRVPDGFIKRPVVKIRLLPLPATNEQSEG